jgi:hypothetical protein
VDHDAGVERGHSDSLPTRRLVSPTYPAKSGALESALYLQPARGATVGRPSEALAEVEETAYREPRAGSHPYLKVSNGQ